MARHNCWRTYVAGGFWALNADTVAGRRMVTVYQPAGSYVAGRELERSRCIMLKIVKLYGNTNDQAFYSDEQLSKMAAESRQ